MNSTRSPRGSFGLAPSSARRGGGGRGGRNLFGGSCARSVVRAVGRARGGSCATGPVLVLVSHRPSGFLRSAGFGSGCIARR